MYLYYANPYIFGGDDFFKFKREMTMRITVVGAGAIGGFLACKLFAAGHQVSVIARGATLTAINEHGLCLHSGDQVLVSRVTATS